jgi:hypothetical protein
VEDEKDARSILDTLPPERRAIVMVVRLPQAVEVIGEYMAAGFGGFTFNNNAFAFKESFELAAELIKSVNGSAVTA